MALCECCGETSPRYAYFPVQGQPRQSVRLCARCYMAVETVRVHRVLDDQMRPVAISITYRWKEGQ